MLQCTGTGRGRKEGEQGARVKLLDLLPAHHHCFPCYSSQGREGNNQLEMTPHPHPPLPPVTTFYAWMITNLVFYW